MKGEPLTTVAFSGPFDSLSDFRKNGGVSFDTAQFRSWSAGCSFPILPTADSGHTFLKLRAHPPLAGGGIEWLALPVQGDFNATTGRDFMAETPGSATSLWPAYKGASFELWNPDTGIFFGWSDPATVVDELQARRLRQARRTNSAFRRFDRSDLADSGTLPCKHPRLAFRDITNRLNERTMIACLVPPDVILTNKAPYLLWPSGDARDEAYLLGVLCSRPLDWYARRVVERSMNFHLLNAFPIPKVAASNALRRRVELISGTLAAVDGRFTAWADSVGVPVGGTDDTTKIDLLAELDAAVALLYGLDRDDIEQIFETFHVGWDYTDSLSRVLGHLGLLEDEHAEPVAVQRQIARGAM